MEPKSRAALLTAALTAAAFGVLALHAAHYLPFISDDSLISLRYAKRLLQGHGLTWTDGPAVEGYSNLLWILLAAGLGGLGVELVQATRWLGFASSALALLALARSYPASTPSRAAPLLAGALTLALSAPLAVWTVGGLEAPLVAALLAWAVALCFPLLDRAGPQRTAAASLCLGLLCVSRPDGPLFAVTAAAAVALLRGREDRGPALAGRLLVLPIVLTAAQLAFRIAYYGDLVPNTARVKISPSWLHVGWGFHYLWRGFVYLAPIAPVGLALLLAGIWPRRAANPQRRARLLFVGALTAAWCLYVAGVGGDIFPAFRQLLPLVVLLAFAVSEGAAWWLERPRSPRVQLLAGALAVVLLGAFAVGQLRHHESRRAVAERFEWRGQVVGLALKQGFGARQPLLAVTAAGAIPYWSELPALDMLGLNDHHLARHPPADFGSGELGHELGDAGYVLERQPDLILYHVGMRGSQLRVGQELRASPEFKQHYVAVRFEGRDPFVQPFTAWVRRESPRIGIRRAPTRVSIPAYLMNANPDSVATLDDTGVFAVEVSDARPALLAGLVLEAGHWRLETDASGETLARVREAGLADRVLVAGATPAEFTLPGTGDRRVQIAVTARPQRPVQLREVSLLRLAPAGQASAANVGQR